jgi:hypothetical protein
VAVEEAEARNVGIFEEVAVEVLALEHGQLVSGHLAAIRAELAVESLAGGQRVVFGLPGAEAGDDLLLEDTEALFEVFEVIEGAGEQLVEGGGDFSEAGLAKSVSVALEVGLEFAKGEASLFSGRGWSVPDMRWASVRTA